MMFVSIAIILIILRTDKIFAYENLALKKPTYQSQPYYSPNHRSATFDSSNAVDGLKNDLSAFGGQCAISADGYKTATFWVNLTSIHSIHDIRIYYRTDNALWGASHGFTSRFLGFYVYVSNTTNIRDGHLCFHDMNYTKATIPAVANITCPVHGQYVIYFNKRPQNSPNAGQFYEYAHTELCEVEIYGCSKTEYYGPECTLPCPDTNCRYCHIETGACQGCKPGFKGHHCELSCDGGRYGQDCGLRCGACLGYKQCHHFNGSCPKGCDAGYGGELCQTACPSGKFGLNCKENCNAKCSVPNQCNGTTGECKGGCQPGWEGLHCNIKCRNNMFGVNCNQSCGFCRNTEKCHHTNGTCQSGCQQGYFGDHCTAECTPGTFGYDCMENCSTGCFNNTCNPVNGYCSSIKETSPLISKSVNFSIIIGGISGLVIGCLLIVIVVLALRRHCLRKKTTERKETERRRKSNKGVAQTNFTSTDSIPSSSGHGNKIIKTENKKSKKCQKNDDEADVDDDEKMHSENPYGDFYANETTIRDIPLNQLESVIVEKRMNEDDGFQREYASLPYGEQYKCDEGKREENTVKNRYKTIFPYDHSRVILRIKLAFGYINANYIEGAHRQNEYIAAQGPKKNTLVDFWTMIWQENVSSIVMLTNLQEGTKIKCSQYWPDVNNKNNYGALSVKMMEEKKYAFYISRRMIVSHNETKKSRSVIQYHYTAWPDYGIPDPLCLVVFLDHVNRTGTNQNSSPTVVHCSAGIGRTGTYIALDVLNQIGKKTEKVNVAEYVKKMRESRMNMVQTYEQYMTIYLALNEIFKSRVNTITLEDFTKKMAAITTDIPANQNILRKEFQILMKIRPVYNDADFKIAKGNCRNGSVTGLFPPIVPNRDSFINAIYVPSFTKSKAFIVTQYPTVEDSVDFLCLLYDQESDIVIFMDPQTTTEPMVTLFPTTSSSKTVPPFTVHLQSKTETDVKTSIFQIRQNNSKKEAHTVTIVEPKSRISASGTSPDTSQLRSLVSVGLGVETENPIIVVSSDGASLCGAFCAVHNVIQQINMDANVDVFTSVRQLQVRRPEFCFRLDEYGLVNKAVNDHIERSTENIYSNQ